MTDSRFKSVLRALSTTWKVISTVVATATTLVLLFVFAAVIIMLLSGDEPEVPDGSALVVAPKGYLVEQRAAAKPVDRAIDELLGQSSAETLVYDVITAIDEAAGDERITAMVLDLSTFSGGSMTKLQDVAAAIDRFRAAGKTVIATSDNYETPSYYLASRADEIVIHPDGLVIIDGLSRYRMYFKDALDKLLIDYKVFKVGRYKSAVEPYLRNDMSPEAKEANIEWMSDLWNAYVEEVSAARDMAPERLREIIDDAPALISAAQGNMAQFALDAGLLDHTLGRIEFRQKMIELVGEDEEADDETYKKIGFATYLEAIGKKGCEDRNGKQKVAVVIARGTILGGEQPPGSIGGESTARLIRKARLDEDVKAIVLRVDSGGGSAFASEVIRRELEKAKEEGKPVVVSMGGVAASGGYWISTPADRIFAHPTTITGSIGIFGAFPTYPRTLAKLGVYVDGVGTTPLSGAIRPDRVMPQEAEQVIQAMIEQGYRQFLGIVAESRGMTVEQVDEIAQGRVWSGMDALELGLVDEFGGIDDAIAHAAERAELGEDYGVDYIEREQNFRQQLLGRLLATAGAPFAGSLREHWPSVPGQEALEAASEEMRLLEQIDDPHGRYALSFVPAD